MDYQNTIDLFQNIRDGYVNQTELLENEANFKSDLGEIKKNPGSKSEEQISVIQNANFF